MPTDLEDALAADPAARESFGAMPPAEKDAWIAWLDRARLPRARRRRVADAVRRLGGTEAVRDTRVVAPPREDPWVWLFGLALLAGLAAFLVWLTVYHHHHHNGASPAPAVVAAKATVPKVAGIRYQSARFQLRQAKLASTLTHTASSKPKGIVIGQAPKAGSTVPRGSLVTLVVSNGPAGVALPDVVGLTAAQAVKALEARKVTAELHHAPSQAPPGTVFAQKPKAGANLKPGETVVLQIAQAKTANTALSVPDVTGQAQAQAVSTLQQAGLRATTAQVPSTQPKGSVVAEHPAAGQKVARGGAVLLNISQGPTSTPTPGGNDYAGMHLSQAIQTLAQGRQQAVVVYVTSSRPAGVVVSSARAGSRERLEVSAGPNPGALTDVPDVTGEDATTAQQDLEAAGFTVIQADWPVSDSTQDGLVVGESPAGGRQVPNGAAVVVYIGSATG